MKKQHSEPEALTISPELELYIALCKRMYERLVEAGTLEETLAMWERQEELQSAEVTSSVSLDRKVED